MKIGPEHIGKKIILGQGQGTRIAPYMIVTAVGGNVFLAKTDYSGNLTSENYYPREDDWKIFEEPKKPSERIAEIIKAPDHSFIARHWSSESQAIIKYLDEQAERKEPQ